MPTENWFKDWFSSPYYHLLYNNRDEKEALAFLKKLIYFLQPKIKTTMLDVACGKGRHSKALAEMGFDVTGIDISFTSIEEAKKNEDDLLHFYQHDMRLPFYMNFFDYAFNFFTSFGYFRTRREHDNSIRTIAQSLKPNGIFVIDYLNVQAAENNQENIMYKKIGSINFIIKKWDDEQHFYKQIQIINSKTGVVKNLFTERVAKFSLNDFTEMFSHQNMQVQEIFGDYKLKKYDIQKSPRMIIVAKKC